MADFHPRCPKCDKLMERGHLPDAAAGGRVEVGTWAAGDPEPRRVVGGIKYHAGKAIPLAAYRCPTCGYIELYARPA